MGILKKIFVRKISTLRQDIVTAKDWIALALNSSNYSADFSLDSLKEIDRFFDEQNVPGGLLSKNGGQRIFALGTYIGEVIINDVGGEWLTDDNDPNGEMNIAVKLNNGNIIWPVQKAMKRFLNGIEDSIYDYACLLKEVD